MNNILKVVTDIGGEVHTEPVGSDDDENIDDHGHMVIMIGMAAVMINVLMVLTFDVFDPVSGRVDHGFEYDADVVDHDLDVFEPVSGG